MILVSGFNVYPNEVEAVIAEHPGVADVAVVGVPDEEPARSWWPTSCGRIRRSRARCCASTAAQSLTDYKVPRSVFFRDELPKSPVGKVLRKDLRGDGARGKPGARRRAPDG